jgi:dihydroxyacetone kinase-like protein
MDDNKQVDVGTLLSSISQVLQQNQHKLNEVDSGPSGGTHGDRITQAFRSAAEAARDAGTDDAGEQLALAAQTMRQQGQGRAVGYYADGLEQASSQFQGKKGISIPDVLPFLQSFLGGVQQNNPAKPGQGTMIDALIPAVTSLSGAKHRRADPGGSILEALGSAVTGARGTVGSRGNHVDPGAASATGILGGIVKALLPGIIGAVAGGMLNKGKQQQSQDTGYGQMEQQGGGGGLGDILGQLTGGGRGEEATGLGQQGSGPLGSLGGLGGIMDMLGGGNNDAEEQQPQQAGSNKPGWWPF